jgi:hypothetical protein
VIGIVSSAIALAKEAGTSRVRKAISMPAGRPSAVRKYRFGTSQNQAQPLRHENLD